MKHRILLTAIAASAHCWSARAAEFHPIASVTTTNTVNFFVKENLIEGAGVGFDAAEPHNRTSGLTWVTDAPNADYFVAKPAPILWFDLGADVVLSEISTWGYADTNTNGAKDFSLRFATSAEGTTGFGTSITYNPIFEATFATAPRDSNVFSQNVTARYVEMTITDNWRGFQGGTPGGDRVGLGEVAFARTIATVGPDIRVPATQTLALDPAASKAFSVPVSNVGDANLVISGTAFTGANAAAFRVTATTSPVASLGTGSVELEFNPTGLGGPIAANLEITSNDADTPVATVMLTGSLPQLGPDISAPMQITLAANGMMETLDVMVSNIGRQTLDLGAAAFSGANAGAFSVVSQAMSIAPGETGAIQISFNPTGLPAGSVDATLRILSNDPETPMLDLPVIGGIPAMFYPIAAITSATTTTDFYPAGNLIQGIGVGFTSEWPHNAIGEGAPSAWVTNAPNGGTGDYFSPLPTPSARMVFDLGVDVALAEVSFWGYANGNANGANLFSLRFATASDGPNGFGNSIAYNPMFAPTQPILPRQSFAFDQTVFARYVEWVPLDNFFGINPPGGDRIGAGEIAFQIVPGSGGDFIITSIERNSPTSVSITFTSNVGSTYAVDRSFDLLGWGNELDDNVMGAAGTTTFTDNTLPANAPAAYYRVRRP
jgi:hypothetical protein